MTLNSLYLVRANASTDGLINFALNADLNNAIVTQDYKPNSLKQVYYTNGNIKSVGISIDNDNYNVDFAGLYINGANQAAATVPEVQALISSLFLDATGGGGGGTTDNTTPPFLVYKDTDGSFRDTKMIDFALEFGKLLSSTYNQNEFDMIDTEDETKRALFHLDFLTTSLKFLVGGAFQEFVNFTKTNGNGDDSFNFTMGAGKNKVSSKKDSVSGADWVVVGDDSLGDSYLKFDNELQRTELKATHLTVGDVANGTTGLIATADNNITAIGDYFGNNSGANISVNGASSEARIETEVVTFPCSRVTMSNLTEYANQAAAIAGGLAIGNLYYTPLVGGVHQLAIIIP